MSAVTKTEADSRFLILWLPSWTRWLTDSDEIWFADAKYHANDDDEQVKIENGSRIPIWRTYLSETESST